MIVLKREENYYREVLRFYRNANVCQSWQEELIVDVKTVSKFAQLEFKYSSPEHGRTIMTGLLANYPRRFDLWSIFLDLEIKQGEPAVIRYFALRCSSLTLDDC